VLRHAQAKMVWVRLTVEDDVLEMTIRDDGNGFDSEGMPSRSGHYGVMDMRERTRLAHGSFSLSSRPGEGTQIRLRPPLPAAEE
jgi:signal transduction histidine kinase